MAPGTTTYASAPASGSRVSGMKVNVDVVEKQEVHAAPGRRIRIKERPHNGLIADMTEK